MALPEYVVTAAIGLVPAACNLWNLPGVARFRARLRRQLPPPVLSEPTPFGFAGLPVADLAVELFRCLPPSRCASRGARQQQVDGLVDNASDPLPTAGRTDTPCGE
jgi:hypothetical protein